MTRQSFPQDYRHRLNAVLTELSLYAKELCPKVEAEASALQYEAAIVSLTTYITRGVVRSSFQ